MKCVVTGNETRTMCNNIPCSAEGRKILSEVHERYNAKMKKEFIDRALGKAKENAEEDSNYDEDTLAQTFGKLAPQISRNSMLNYIKIGVKDAIETLEEVKNATEDK